MRGSLPSYCHCLGETCCLGAATDEPDYGKLLGAVAATDGCRPSGDANRDVLPSGRPQAPWLFPVPGGYVTDNYGWRIRPTTGAKQFHEGLDIGKGEGSDIVAPADGKVVYVNQNPSVSSGRYITVEHAGGWKSLYLHLLSPAVVLGQQVSAGQRIGLMGKTGVLSNGKPAVTGPHLHWIVKDPCGNVVNPLVTLKGRFPKKVSGVVVPSAVSGLYSGGISWGLVALLFGAGWFFSSRRH